MERDAYEEFLDGPLARLDETVHDYFARDFDDVLVSTVRSTFPEHEQEQFVEHYRGLVGAWAADEAARTHA